jgi:YD repeat-containing protein
MATRATGAIIHALRLLRDPGRSPSRRLLARGLIGVLVLAGTPLEVWAYARFDPPLSAPKTSMGNRETATNSRGTTNYTYDNRNRLETLTYPDGRKLTYGYDANGNRTSLTAEVGGETLTTTYSYDELNRLQTVTDSEGRDYVHECVRPAGRPPAPRGRPRVVGGSRRTAAHAPERQLSAPGQQLTSGNDNSRGPCARPGPGRPSRCVAASRAPAVAWPVQGARAGRMTATRIEVIVAGVRRAVTGRSAAGGASIEGRPRGTADRARVAASVQAGFCSAPRKGAECQ